MIIKLLWRFFTTITCNSSNSIKINCVKKKWKNHLLIFEFYIRISKSHNNTVRKWYIVWILNGYFYMNKREKKEIIKSRNFQRHMSDSKTTFKTILWWHRTLLPTRLLSSFYRVFIGILCIFHNFVINPIIL